MAIVPDLARDAYNEWGDYKVPPYNGTPPRTWQNSMAWLLTGTEVHINQPYESGTDNTADDWVPMQTQVSTLDKTGNTWRPA